MYHASGYLFFFWHVNYCCEFCKNERYSINFSICISHFKQLVLSQNTTGMFYFCNIEIIMQIAKLDHCKIYQIYMQV